MGELTKLRIIDKRQLAPYLEAWKRMEWSIVLRDDFGGLITGVYKPGPALIEAIHRLDAVFELSAEEMAEITHLERVASQRAQERVNELVRAKANAFYGSLVQHFSSELIPSIKGAINDLVSRVVELMVKEFGGDPGVRDKGDKKRGPKPLFVNKGECLAFITYAEKRIQDSGKPVTLSAIAREIMTLKGRKVERAYRVLKGYLDKFEIQWTPKDGAASKL